MTELEEAEAKELRARMEAVLAAKRLELAQTEAGEPAEPPGDAAEDDD